MNAFSISPFSLDHVQLAFRGPKKLSTACDDGRMSCRKAVRAELVPEVPVYLYLSLILPRVPLFVNIVYNINGDRQQVVLFPDELEEEQVRKLPYKEDILEKYA